MKYLYYLLTSVRYISTLFHIVIILICVYFNLCIDVFIYDPSQQSTDQSSDILNNCNCSNTDIVTSFSDGWNNIYTKSQSVSNIENINFYFLSNLMITNDDIDNNINDLIQSLPQSNSSNINNSNISIPTSTPTISINFQCGKSMFNSITWSSNECILTFNDAIQDNTDSFLFIDDNITNDIDTNILINDLTIYFDPNDNSNVTSPGIIFQTLEGNANTNTINLIFDNIIIDGAFNTNGPLIAITQCLVYILLYIS